MHTHTQCVINVKWSHRCVCVPYIPKAVLSAAPSYLHKLQALPPYATICTHQMNKSHNYMYTAHTNVYIIYVHTACMVYIHM